MGKKKDILHGEMKLFGHFHSKLALLTLRGLKFSKCALKMFIQSSVIIAPGFECQRERMHGEW